MEIFWIKLFNVTFKKPKYMFSDDGLWPSKKSMIFLLDKPNCIFSK